MGSSRLGLTYIGLASPPSLIVSYLAQLVKRYLAKAISITGTDIASAKPNNVTTCVANSIPIPLLCRALLPVRKLCLPLNHCTTLANACQVLFFCRYKRVTMRIK